MNKTEHACGVCGYVGTNTHRFKGEGQWLCIRHYARMMTRGTTDSKPPCKIVVDGDTARIITKSGTEYLIDASDVRLVSDRAWNASGHGYAQSFYMGKRTKLHRLIMNVEDERMEVDHIDGDPRNNRRSNLRICTHAENMRNYKNVKSKSGVKGVFPVGNKFYAYITLNRKKIGLGRFDTLDAARQARLDAEHKYFGEFAPSLCRTANGGSE